MVEAAVDQDTEVVDLGQDQDQKGEDLNLDPEEKVEADINLDGAEAGTDLEEVRVETEEAEAKVKEDVVNPEVNLEDGEIEVITKILSLHFRKKYLE